MLNRMVARFIDVVRLLIVLASRHRTLVLENLALQQQLAVDRRTRPRPAIRWSDRLFWIGLRWACFKGADDTIVHRRPCALVLGRLSARRMRVLPVVLP